MKRLGMKLAIRIMMIGITSISLCQSTVAQTAYAGIAVVTQPGVTIQRENTTDWLPLDAGSQTPIGFHDKLRTDDAGRAFVSLLDEAELLILPNTTYEILSLEANSTHVGSIIIAAVDGHIIQQVTSPERLASFQLETEYATISQPAKLFAVWTDPAYTIITIARGTAQIRAADAEFAVDSNEGIRIAAAVDTVPLNAQSLTAARVIGKLDGCPGIISTVTGLNLNIRIAPGMNAAVIGNIPNGSDVPVMAISESKNWLRIQFLSGFGWLRSSLVNHDCHNLTVLPNTFVEENRSLFNIGQAELAYLAPFYGLPKQDRWFYLAVE